MGGLVIDDIIRMIVRNVRRGIRMRRAAKWQTANGRIERFRTMEGDSHRLRPVVDYEFEVGDETQYGSVAGFPQGPHEINEIGDAADNLHILNIRYNPDNPAINRALNSDNPDLPFTIDHENF